MSYVIYTLMFYAYFVALYLKDVYLLQSVVIELLNYLRSEFLLLDNDKYT